MEITSSGEKPATPLINLAPPINHNPQDPREPILRRLLHDRVLAHKLLFKHRHRNADPDFHSDLLSLLYSPHPWVAAEAFRGAAKSTRMEEIIILGALFGDFKYAIIIGNSYDRACERLAAIKNELVQNDAINELFGEQSGGVWAADQIVLPNGCKIQAFGARQSLRGAKHNDQRPDYCFVDDLEDEENVATEEARRKLKRWFTGALIPALVPKLGKIRMVGTPLHPQSFLESKINDKAWVSRKFPAIYIDDTGQEKSLWEDRFPLTHLQQLRLNFLETGNAVEWEQEYMCRSEDVAQKAFQPNMIKVQAALSVWTPVQIFVDPARTTKIKTSARTGYAVWGWVGSKLYVHEAFGAFHKPDEILRTIFELNEKYSPVEIGVEADGLEEFIMQPLRVEQVKRGITLPIKSEHAPRNKDDFIKGLQPFYLAGEVIHTKDLPDLVSELLQFPSGRKDVPNALAYALRMRSGKPVYEDFSLGNISPEIKETTKKEPVYLAMSARAAVVSGVLVQYVQGNIIIYRDWCLSGQPNEVTEQIIRESILFAGKEVIPVIPREQFDKYTNFGLVQELRTLRLNPREGGLAASSQGVITPWLKKLNHGSPAVVVSDSAKWVMNGFSRGYIRKLNKAGMIEDHPENNIYAVVMEALESFFGWFDVANKNNNADPDNLGYRYGTTNDGRRYLTSRGGAR